MVDGLFCHAHSSAIATWCVPLARLPASGDQPLSPDHIRKPKPFVWTADPDCIIERVEHGYQAIVSTTSFSRVRSHVIIRSIRVLLRGGQSPNRTSLISPISGHSNSFCSKLKPFSYRERQSMKTVSRLKRINWSFPDLRSSPQFATMDFELAFGSASSHCPG